MKNSDTETVMSKWIRIIGAGMAGLSALLLVTSLLVFLSHAHKAGYLNTTTNQLEVRQDQLWIFAGDKYLYLLGLFTLGIILMAMSRTLAAKLSRLF